MSEHSCPSTRTACIAALAELMETDPAVAVVFADTTQIYRVPDTFLAKFRHRIFDVGIAEQNAVGVAAGLAACGLKVFVASYAGFLTMRACEQVRTCVAYPGLDVKFVGANGGLMGGEREGATHQFIEDLAIVRAIPGITVVVPADAHQAGLATKALARIRGPAYLRLGSGRDPVVYQPPLPFELGKIRTVRASGDDVVLFANGFLISRCLEAADRLQSQGIGSHVVEVHTLRPLDTPGIHAELEATRAAVAVEDHSIIGGLGSALAEVMAEQGKRRLARIGVRDVFPESGEAPALLDRYGMSTSDIVAAAHRVLHFS